VANQKQTLTLGMCLEENASLQVLHLKLKEYFPRLLNGVYSLQGDYDWSIEGDCKSRQDIERHFAPSC